MRTRVATISVLCLLFGLPAAPARAQSAGVSDRATGETYHVEVGGYFWSPTPDIAITSESLPGIPGSRIDFVSDLGIEQTRFRQLKLVLRPATKHKFRFEYTPITYEAVGSLTADIVFNGIRFPVTFPVETNLEWKAYRFGYEWDFVYRDRGFVGVVLEAKYTRRRSDAEERPRHGVRQGTGADSGHRRHRPRLCRPEHLDHRRVQRHQAAREDRRGLPRQVLRLRSLRHGQLHEQLRRPGRLPIARACSTK